MAAPKRKAERVVVGRIVVVGERRKEAKRSTRWVQISAESRLGGRNEKGRWSFRFKVGDEAILF